MPYLGDESGWNRSWVAIKKVRISLNVCVLIVKGTKCFPDLHICIGLGFKVERESLCQLQKK